MELKSQIPASMQESYVSTACRDDKILQTPMCEEVLKSRLMAIKMKEQEAVHSRNVMLTILLVITAGIAALVYSTRCNECKKFFSKTKIHEEHLGTDFSGFSVQSEQTGTIKNSDQNTIATIHTDRKYANYTTTKRSTYRCRFCGHTDSQIETSSHKELTG